ncbi:hypothetical protein EDD18DRAFT_1339811 [Armillaria luteobubalina]|uniref:Uncharacterized protein n=1 Tax=Armillaria luteobubalina TaxID=153913 RepID=A0AA39T9F6_9AGAR|nr:hypothetical protein EDD18DRAFT_1339811 [Armillaria luteobubalina]
MADLDPFPFPMRPPLFLRGNGNQDGSSASSRARLVLSPPLLLPFRKRFPAWLELVRSVTPHILVSALRKDKASFHQGTLVSVISRGTTIETSQGLFLRTTLPTPLVQLPHDINYTPDFELESLTIVEVPDSLGHLDGDRKGYNPKSGKEYRYAQRGGGSPALLSRASHRLPAFVAPEHRASRGGFGSGGIDNAGGGPSFGSEAGGEIRAEGEGRSRHHAYALEPGRYASISCMAPCSRSLRVPPPYPDLRSGSFKTSCLLSESRLEQLQMWMVVPVDVEIGKLSYIRTEIQRQLNDSPLEVKVLRVVPDNEAGGRDDSRRCTCASMVACRLMDIVTVQGSHVLRAARGAFGSEGVDDARGHPGFGSEAGSEICARGEGETGLTKERDTAAVESRVLHEHEEDPLTRSRRGAW